MGVRLACRLLPEPPRGCGVATLEPGDTFDTPSIGGCGMDGLVKLRRSAGGARTLSSAMGECSHSWSLKRVCEADRLRYSLL